MAYSSIYIKRQSINLMFRGGGGRAPGDSSYGFWSMLCSNVLRFYYINY